MKRSQFGRCVVLLTLSCGLAAWAGPNFTEDFDDNAKDATRWGNDFNFAGSGGAFSETAGRLEFTQSSPVEGTRVRPWILQSPAYTRDWEVFLKVTSNRTFASQTDGVSLGIAVQNPVNTSQAVTAEIYADHFGTPSEGFFSALIDGGGVVATFDSGDLNAHQGSLRVTFDSTARVLTTYYRFGSGDWVFMASYGIGGSGGTTANLNWGMTAGSEFRLAVFGYSGGIVVNSGEIFADDFQLALNTRNSSVNFGPTFDTSPPMTAAIGDAYLYTVMTTDFEQDAVTYSKIAGPDWLSVAPDGTVTGMPLESDTGTHEITIRATDDGLFPNYGEQTYHLVVRASFAGWQKLHFTLPLESSLAQPNSDPDSDGVPNLFEYALRMDPRTGGDRFTPRRSLAMFGELEFRFEARDDAPGLSIVAQFSHTPDFVNPMNTFSAYEGQDDNDGYRTEVYTDALPLKDLPARFVRFKVTVSE